jgi:hypothetical protein
MSEEIKKNIKLGKIVKGMNTLQASLAGGAYFFRVVADPDVWDKDTDPNIIIKAQIENPDNSQIWMTFQNNTQYKKKGIQAFQVEFQKGKVVDIKNITEEIS